MPIGSPGFHRSSPSATSTTTSANGAPKRLTVVTLRPYSNIGRPYGDRHDDAQRQQPRALGGGGGGSAPPHARAPFLPPPARLRLSHLWVDRGAYEPRRPAVRTGPRGQQAPGNLLG